MEEETIKMLKDLLRQAHEDIKIWKELYNNEKKLVIKLEEENKKLKEKQCLTTNSDYIFIKNGEMVNKNLIKERLEEIIKIL